MESDSKQKCNRFGGLWNLIKTPQYKFCEENMSALEDIMYEITEYRFCRQDLKINYLGFEDDPLRYDINIVKQMLKKNYVKFSKKDSEERLLRIAYEYFKIKIRKYIEKMLIISNKMLYFYHILTKHMNFFICYNEYNDFSHIFYN